MATPSRISQRLRFCEFELDLNTRELWTNGRKQTLAPQTFLVLQILLENQGQVVTREEFIRRLWPSDTFVDFEQGLKKAIARARELLGDSAEEPRIIETLPRQGYRFIADALPSVGTQPFDSHIPLQQSVVVHPEMRPAESLAVAPDKPQNKAILWVACVAVLLGIAPGILLLRRLPSSEPPTLLESRALTNDGLPKFSLVCDGARLYFVERVAGKSVLQQMSVEGGEMSPISTPFLPEQIFDVSRGGSKLLVGGPPEAKRRQLWVVPLPAGAPHRVGDVLANGAAWAPDGQHLAYTSGREVFLTGEDGASPQLLFSATGGMGMPRFSPAGDRFRFTQFDPRHNTVELWEVHTDGKRHNTVELWEVHTDGKEMHPLLPGMSETPQSCCGIWSGDRGRFFFLSWLANSQIGQDIWALKEGIGNKPSAPSKLTNGPLIYKAIAAGSDPGTLFAIGVQARAELTAYDARSSSFRPFLGGISAGDVDISRDGQWITYVRYPELTLWRSKLDGNDRRQLTFPPVQPFAPRWSPQGDEIIFTDLRLNSGRLLAVSRDNGVPRELLPQDRDAQIDASWLPDGKSIVFARTHEDPNLAIFRADLNTGVLQKITNSNELTAPRLSPDGRLLVALSRDWTTLKLYDMQTQKWTDLLRADPGQIGSVNWSNDGRSLYIRKSPHQILRIDLANHQLSTVLDVSNFPEPMPEWMGLGPDDSILLRRDLSTYEIYRLTLRNGERVQR